MRTQTDRIDLVLALVVDPRFDEVVGEHTAGLKERVVGFKCVERSFESCRNLRNLGEFFRRKVVEVLVDRSRRFDAVLNAVETSEHHRREGEVRVAGGVGATELDALGLRALRCERNTNRSGTVALAVHKVHRCFVTRHQTLERVGGGVRERDHRVGVVEKTTDVPTSDVGKTAITSLVVEQR